MDAGGDRGARSDVFVVREVYEDYNAPQTFVEELERALDYSCNVIVIEPASLGEETARWITCGNYLHKTAVLSGLGSIITGVIWHENPFVCTPLGILSVLSTGLYTASWQFDNCVKYQVEKDPRKLARLPILSTMAESSPVVLVRKDDSSRKILHWSVTVCAATMCAFRWYQSLK